MANHAPSLQPVKVRLWNKYFLLLMVINFFSSLCNQFFNPTLSLHLEALGSKEAVIGLHGTFMTLGSAVFRILGGKFADKRGRRISMFLGLLLFMAASSVFIFADSVILILLLRAVQGMGFGLCSTAVTAAVADVLPYDSMASGIGYFGLAHSLAQTIGPSCAVGLYYSEWGFPAVAAVATCSLALSAAFTFTCRYEKNDEFLSAVGATRPAKTQAVQDAPAIEYKGIWKYFEKSAIPCGVVMLFCCLASGVITGFAVLYAKTEGIATENAGLFFSISAIGVVVSRLGTGKLVRKYGTLPALLIAFFCGIASFLLLIAAKQAPVLFFVAGAFNGLSTGLYNPALNTEAMDRAPTNRRGAASATFQVPVEFGFALSSLIAGFIVMYSSYTVTWAVCIAYDVIGVLLSLIFFRKKKA